MKPTQREAAAMSRLADAALEFLMAFEEGRTLRRGQRPREEVAVRVEHVHPQPQQPEKPGRGGERSRTLLTAKQAAAELSIGDRTLWTMTAPRGPLPSVRIGRAVRYDLDDLHAAIAQMRVKPRRSS
ncbi:MAG: helix-turn-helix domain-containing protein [Planctomycetota bacterium]|nr:helix-turn-helix domain-containing protein [Planctomycetota bacterium]